MQTLLLNESFITQIKDYINSQEYAEGTKIVYNNNIDKISKKYKELNDKNIFDLNKKLKSPSERAMFKLINDFCYLKKIPFNIGVPSLRRKPRKIPQTLSVNEIKIMINSTPEKYKLFIRSIFGFGAGLRISEAISISWHRFDWDGWLYEKDENFDLPSKLKPKEERMNGVYIIHETKRGKTFPITVPKKLMEDYYSLAEKEGLLNEWGVPKSEVPVFDFGYENFKSGLRMSNPILWKNRYIKHAYDYIRYNLILKKYNPALNKKVHIHSLRHSRASQLLEQGVPLEVIQKLLGHERIDTTTIYAKVSLGKIREIMEDKDTI